MMRKRFDRQLYEQNDKLAKENVLKALDKRKYKIEENPKKRGVDLLVYRQGKHVLNIETEIKRVWKTKDFPYDSVQIPERKSKYAKLTVPTIFVMFNDKQNSYLVIKDKDLMKSPKKEVANRFVYKGEMFFQVPMKKVSFNNLNKIIEEVING